MKIVGVLALSLALCAQAQQLVGIRHDVTPTRLVEINRANAALTDLAPVTPGPLTGLAFDTTRGALLGIHPFEDRVYRINPLTGESTALGPVDSLGFPNSNALAYDPGADRLYTADINDDRLISIDPATGVGTLIGPLTGGFLDIEGMAFNPATSTLYGLSDAVDRLVRINVLTGAATAIGPQLPAGTWRGLEYDAVTNRLYASELNTPGLYRINPATGISTFVGSWPAGTRIQGLAIIPAPGALVLVGAGLVAAATRRRR